MDLGNLLNRAILPALHRCAVCGKPKEECQEPFGKARGIAPDHKFERDKILPEWHGWHAARRGLGTNLYRMGVPEKTTQGILRHANVSTTNTYYIKSAADDTPRSDGEARTARDWQRAPNRHSTARSFGKWQRSGNRSGRRQPCCNPVNALFTVV